MFKQIAKHTSMLRLDERVCGTVYMIEEGGKRLIVDAGDGIAPLDFAPDICLLTHGHFDHTRGVKPDWGQVLLHPAEFDFKGPYVSIPENAKPNPMAAMEFGSHRIDFFHTPGHTEGSICVFDRTTGLLFSGDTKFAGKGVGRTDLGGDAQELAASLKAIEEIPYRLLCPGHGELEGKL